MNILLKLVDACLFVLGVFLLAYVAGAALVITVLSLPILLWAAGSEYVKRWSRNHAEIMEEEADAIDAQMFRDRVNDDIDHYCTETDEPIC